MSEFTTLEKQLASLASDVKELSKAMIQLAEVAAVQKHQATMTDSLVLIVDKLRDEVEALKTSRAVIDQKYKFYKFFDRIIFVVIGVAIMKAIDYFFK